MAEFIRTRLVSINLKKFKSYDDYTVDLVADNAVQRVMGFFGPNGTGKSTMLDAIGLLFQNYVGYDKQRLMTAMKRYVRNAVNPDVAGEVEANFDENGEMVGTGAYEGGGADSEMFVVEGEFITEEGEEYVVKIGNHADFFKWVDGSITGLADGHPSQVKRTLMKQCYTTNYDKELNKFQLRRDRWPVFKKLFEAVTGFPVEPVDVVLDEKTVQGGQNRHLALLDKYVLGLRIQKPHETISERQCSDGERKIVKNFTTLLNNDRIPSIIMIDNIEMHVEVDRHVALLECVAECFPDSQVIFTTHSQRIITEYNLNNLICLANKKIPRQDTWRQEILRKIKGLKLAFKDSQSTDRCISLSKKMLDESFFDKEEAKNDLTTLVVDGSAALISEIKEFAE